MFTQICCDLQNVVCDFAFRATYNETILALDNVLFLKGLDLHPFVLNSLVYDYTGAHRTIYDKGMRIRVLEGYRYWDTGRVRSPLDIFFVWFCLDDLFDHERILRVLEELDWRTIRPLIKDLPHRSRIDFFASATDTLAGISRCSELFDQISLQHLKTYPSNEVRFMVHRVNALL